MPIKYKKLKHYNIEGHAHFLTFSCYRRLPLLSKDRTCLWLSEAIERARGWHQFDLWAWVIMPDHAHLLIHPRKPEYSIASILQSIKQPVGRKAIAHLRKHAPTFLNKLKVVSPRQTHHFFWQPGAGHDKNEVDPAAIHETIDYMHQNPVKAKLVKIATDWRWSSARDWAGLDFKYLKVDRTMPSWLPAD